MTIEEAEAAYVAAYGRWQAEEWRTEGQLLRRLFDNPYLAEFRAAADALEKARQEGEAMIGKFYWEMTIDELMAQVKEAEADGSQDESYRLAEKVFPPHANKMDGDAPMYYGWAIREAFLAGVRWERKRGKAN